MLGLGVIRYAVVVSSSFQLYRMLKIKTVIKTYFYLVVIGVRRWKWVEAEQKSGGPS